MAARTKMEQLYPKEFEILKKHGQLTGDWENVYEHCKTECAAALALAELLQLNDADKNILAKAAILHDWYKRKEGESSVRGFDEYNKAVEMSFDELIKLGVDKRIVEVAHSVGHTSLLEIQSTDDELRKLMHYIDDITMGDKIVGLNTRIDYLEGADRYKELNESGRKVHSGQTYFEVQRNVGKEIEEWIINEIRKKYGDDYIKSFDLIQFIDRKIKGVFYWNKFFIEIATRAIRKAHFDYQVINSGQNDIDTFTFNKINSGIGIELVPEETVRDYIVNELLAMGFWKRHKIDGEYRSYWTEREFTIDIPLDSEEAKKIYSEHLESSPYFKERFDNEPPSKLKLSVDMTVARYEQSNERNKYSPVLLELKRLNTKIINLSNKGTPWKGGQSTKEQIKEIFKDIAKLRFIRDCLKKRIGNGLENHLTNEAILGILVWGVIDSEDELSELYKKLDFASGFTLVRVFPTQWDMDGKVVQKWCTILLAEVDNHNFIPFT